MDKHLAVKVENLGKLYKVYPEPMGRVVEWATRGKAVRHSEHWAIRHVSFELPRGSALGVVGANGAGKSTLLKMLSRTTTPTEGSYTINGRLGSLLELGGGFHPDFSGRDNLYMNAALMGIPRSEVRERFDELADFAELGEYMEKPVRIYSSGMAMRLGFTAAMMVKPEVLILDEILAVGDQHFQKKCMDKIRDIRRSGTSILFVAHAVAHIRSICDQAIWIHDGRVIEGGDPQTVTDNYVNFQHAEAGGREAQIAEAAAAQGMTSSVRLPHMRDIKLCKAGTLESETEFETGTMVDIHCSYQNPTGDNQPYHMGIIVSRNDDVQVFTARSKEARREFRGPEGTLVLRVPLTLTRGEFYVSGYLLDEECEQVIDQRLAWARFKITYEGTEKGVLLSEAEWLSPQEAR